MNVRLEALSTGRVRQSARIVDYVQLTKPRITALVVLTTYVGFYCGMQGRIDPWLVLHALLGTALVCGGSSALNQVWEREADSRMLRTQRRPLPAERLGQAEALLFGVALAIVGLLELALFVNMLASFLAAATLAIYLFVYTPLKRRTWHCTTVGAVPGALPPVIGWAAARGGLDLGAWSLFAIVFIWQLPHFYAIAWMYRDDYRRGGFPMLTVIDPDGAVTGRQIVAWTTALVPASLLPVLLGMAGTLYLVGALVLGGGFLVLALRLAWSCEVAHARRVFLASIVYLPVLLGLLVLDRVPPL
jgi:protoheme IX farnesyltransferase